MSDSTRDSLRELAPGYVLGALSPEETRSFEAGMAGSPELQREVAELRELSGLLALQEERSPAPELKQRLRERIATEKSADISGVSPIRPASRRNIAAWALGIGLAASLALSVGLFLRNRTLMDAVRDREQQLGRREATLNAILEPAVQLTTLTATGEAPPVVQVFWNRAANSLIVHTFRLKPAPTGRAYQLWLMRKQGGVIASAVFNPDSTGHQLVQGVSVPANEDIAGFAITEEPAGGSPQPTSKPILAGNAGGG